MISSVLSCKQRPIVFSQAAMLSICLTPSKEASLLVSSSVVCLFLSSMKNIYFVTLKQVSRGGGEAGTLETNFPHSDHGEARHTYHLPKDRVTWTRPQSPTFPSFLIIGPFGISLKAFPTLPTRPFGVLKGDPWPAVLPPSLGLCGLLYRLDVLWPTFESSFIFPFCKSGCVSES